MSGAATSSVSPGRKLAITNGVFEVPDTYHRRAAGARCASASTDRCRPPPSFWRWIGCANSPARRSMPATSRGTLSAQVSLGHAAAATICRPARRNTRSTWSSRISPPRHLVMGQKIEASNLRVSANNQGYYIRGDVKINGVPAALDYRKPRGDADAEVRIQATLDDAARGKLGFDVGSYLSGPVPVKLNGRVAGTSDGESRYAVEADLTQARIDRLLPGWIKPAGQAGRARPSRSSTSSSRCRFEDIAIEGAGHLRQGRGRGQRGRRDCFRQSSDLRALGRRQGHAQGRARTRRRAAGDDARRSLRRPRLRQVGDGRALAASRPSRTSRDVDIDVRLGTVAGFHGETLRGVDLRMSRRGGIIKSFTLNAKLGRDTPLNGDLRGKAGGRNVLYVETADAGAFFRFSDTYRQDLWRRDVGRDGPADRRSAARRRTASSTSAISGARRAGARSRRRRRAAAAGRPGIGRWRRRVLAHAGRVHPHARPLHHPRGHREGAGDRRDHRGLHRLRQAKTCTCAARSFRSTASTTCSGRFRSSGCSSAAATTKGLVGLTYEVVGPPGAPILRVNPISVVAPGLIRKFFEFPTGNRPQSYAEPTASGDLRQLRTRACHRIVTTATVDGMRCLANQIAFTPA